MQPGGNVGAVQHPDDLRYSADHEWARMEGGAVRVGITDYAQGQLGTAVFVQLPEVGAQVTAGEPMGEVESSKSVSELFAPVSGTVVAVNDALAAAPEQLNEDPYGAGWVCVIEVRMPAELDDLMDGSSYRGLVGE